MKFRLLLTGAAATLLAISSALAARPNIVLFVTDDQSPIAGCYGSPLIQTPFLDQLAAEGTRFTNAYATTASCSASRSVMLTGLQNHANGQFGHTHDYHKFDTFKSCAALSLPNQLRANGYRTAHIGKLHVAPEVVYQFDRYLPEKGGGHNTPAWVESCKPLFNEESDKPFFLCFWTHDPHRSGDVEESAPEKLKPNRFGNPPAGKSYPGTPELVYDPAEVPVPAYLPDTIECRREIAQYYQSCTRTDKALGKLVEALKEAGQYENTMIIYTADHGMAFPGAKTTVYEAGLKVPFVVRMPGAAAGGIVNDAMISHVDITPSLLDAAGGYEAGKQAPKHLLPVPKVGRGENAGFKFDRYHGRSWLPLLDSRDSTGWDEVFASHTFHEIQMYYPMRAVIGRHYKLIWNIAAPLPYPFASDLWAASTWQAQYEKGMDANYGNRSVDSYIHRPPFELYNITDDPAESRNLAGDPEFAGKLGERKQRLKLKQEETRDPWRIKWRYE
ncbi:sulfatase family protein [Luteolibacter marinus]|uniref:sulfatase family protein n=1 Tax=Luteolibacter marinus TaxID=2776705 RepID=UPI0018673370|nr:sulfatase [Luteolibacter marinus]